MENSADPDQLASSEFFRSQLISIYTVCKGRVYPGSAWQGLILLAEKKNKKKNNLSYLELIVVQISMETNCIYHKYLET